MVLTLGIVLIGGHFFLVTSVASDLSEHQSGLSFVAFMAFVTLSGYFVTKIQSEIELRLIRRHVRKNPRSGWNVVVQRER